MAPLPDVAILCGGLGTRIRDVLGGLPKALAPVNGQPFLAGLITALKAAGLRRFVLCTGVGAEQIERQFTDVSGVVFSAEAEPLGTGGALGWARPHLHSDPVLVMNGDSTVPGLDWGAFQRSLPAHGAGAMVLVPRDARSDAGAARLDASGRVTAFAEKSGIPGESFQNAGIYLLGQALLRRIPSGQPSSLERDLMPQWVVAGMYGYIHRGALIDIGTPERLARAQAMGARAVGGLPPAR
jgi:NDP-sugar pyrophosphorylase family protein